MLARIVGNGARFALRHFFHEIRITGAKPVEEGPLIVIGNHPYAIVDPLLIASAYNRDFSFLAKSTLFKGRIQGALLRTLNMIPINRVQDGGSQRDNLKTLDETAQYVNAGRALIAFAEGRSDGKRQIQPLKNGMARVALLAEQLSQFGANVKIQVVGLTYSDFSNPFKSTVTIHLQEPITVAEWREKCEKHFALAARDLTRRIDEDLHAATADISDDDSRLAEMVAALYRDDQRDDLTRFKVIGETLKKLPPEAASAKQEISDGLEEYSGLVRKLRVNPGVESPSIANQIGLLAIAPLVYAGWGLHYIPYRIAQWRSDAIKCKLADRGYNKLKMGAKIFGAWYAGLAVLLVALMTCGLLSWLPTLLILFGHTALGALVSKKLRSCNACLMELIGYKPFRRLKELGAELREQAENLRRSITVMTTAPTAPQADPSEQLPEEEKKSAPQA